MNVLQNLFSSRRVWLAVVAVVVTAAGVAFPQISPALIETARTFALALIVAFTVDDTAVTIKG